MTSLTRRIGVDMDGVVRNMYHPLIHIFQTYYKNVDIDPIEKWTNYKIWNHFYDENGPVDEAWFKNIWFNGWAEVIYWKQAFCYPYATEVLRKQQDKGHKIIFITAQPSRYTMGLTMKFISKWAIPFDEIHFTDYDSKYKVDCDVYIEDSPHQLKSLCKNTHYHNVWVYDQPWNREFGWKYDKDRFYSWLDIDKELNRRFQ